MALKIGANTNTYNEVNAPLEVNINDTTYTEVLPADPERIGYKITQVKRDILVKEMAPNNPDQLDRGFQVSTRESYESKHGHRAVGVISIKSLNGDTTVLVVGE